MNFGQLIASTSQDLWPSGEQENLVGPHLKFFIQAMVDLQQSIPCLRFGNTDFFPQCSSFFNCGMTVLPQPQGQVLRVCTIGKVSTASAAPIADLTINAPLLALNNGVLSTPVTTGTVGTVETDGVYTLSVAQSNPFNAIYGAAAPQYFTTTISYTDTNGNPQTVQPAPIIHLSDAGKSGSVAVNIKAGTPVTYTITPFNQPQADGQIAVEMKIVSGETGASDDDWCSKVYYQQVAYSHIERYVRAGKGQQNSLWSVANAMVANICGHWRVKRRYNPPSDIGFENQPALPPGFHYPQTSTDAGGRSRSGVYAVKHGRIYIAPWIESSESVIVEWNGIKTNWAPTDLISDDPKLLQAVRLLVGIQHYTHYEDNDKRLADFRAQYYGVPGAPGVLRELIVECRERNRVRSLNEVGGEDGDFAGGVGIISGTSSNTGIYYSAAASFTATGANGQPYTINIPAGQYSSTLSQADADAQALAQATTQAQSQAQSQGGSGSSGTTPGTFLNVPQFYTARCPAASGNTPAAQGTAVTVTIPAGQYQSVVSQAFADAAALQAAQVAAQNQLSCTYYNAPQTATTTCANNTTESATVGAGQYTSTLSQADADGQAQAQAQALAVAQCANPAGAYTVGNTIQYVPYTLVIPTSCGTFYSTGAITVAANTFLGQTDAANESTVRAQLNTQALTFAQVQINALTAQLTAQYEVTKCIGIGGRGFGGGGIGGSGL